MTKTSDQTEFMAFVRKTYELMMNDEVIEVDSTSQQSAPGARNPLTYHEVAKLKGTLGRALEQLEGQQRIKFVRKVTNLFALLARAEEHKGRAERGRELAASEALEPVAEYLRVESALLDFRVLLELLIRKDDVAPEGVPAEVIELTGAIDEAAAKLSDHITSTSGSERDRFGRGVVDSLHQAIDDPALFKGSSGNVAIRDALEPVAQHVGVSLRPYPFCTRSNPCSLRVEPSE